MPHATSSPPRQYVRLIRALIIGTLMLLIGLALGLKLRTPAPAEPFVVETDAPTVDPAHATATTSLFTTANSTDEAPFEQSVSAMPSSSADGAGSSSADGSDEYDPAIALRRQELQYLQEVQPDNLMIPQDKSPQQLDALWHEFQHYHALQHRIDTGSASEEDREQYYAIRLAKYEEEKALIELCNDVAANMPADPDSEQATLCTHMAATSAERLQVIEASIEELEQQRLYSARID